ncbi:hypothetical protein, partial [Xanthomonas albilineans]|uniref:hypothetical protein n=1 Tax=Xanthomonas albilineans TaxID=29447 RepID=UPI001E29E485
NATLFNAMRICVLISASRLTCGTFPDDVDDLFLCELSHNLIDDYSLYRFLREVSAHCTGTDGHMVSCRYVLSGKFTSAALSAP